VSFVTTLTLRSADRDALDGAVADLRSTLEGKGAEFKGPRAEPTTTLRIPLYESATGDEIDSWDYTVFTREVEIVGHDDLSRSLAERSFDDAVHVAVSVDRIAR
jgi:ribosomal protein S10